MILIGMITVCIGIPLLIIVVGVALLWLGMALVNCARGG
jgi:hypothetical protein